MLVSLLFICISSFLLEGFQELEKVARCLEALEQKMYVIWHQTIGVNGDPVDGGCTLKAVYDPVAGSLAVKNSFVVLAAESDEIPSRAAVVFCGEADIFVDEDHRVSNKHI